MVRHEAAQQRRRPDRRSGTGRCPNGRIERAWPTRDPSATIVQMIELVDEALVGWLATIDPSPEVEFERRLPTGDDTSPSGVRVVLVLGRVAEQVTKRDNRIEDVRGSDGAVRARQRPTRYFELDYWCAITGPAADAHRTLGAIVQRLVDHEFIPREHLPGPLAELDLSLDVQLVVPSNAAAALAIRVVLPVRPSPDLEISAPATVLHLDVSPPPGADPATTPDAGGEEPAPTGPEVLRERTWTTVRRRELIGRQDGGP